MASYDGAFSLGLDFGLSVTGPGQYSGAFALGLEMGFVVGGSGFSVLPATSASLAVTSSSESALTLTPATTGSLSL